MNNVEVVKGTNEYTAARRHSEYWQRKETGEENIEKKKN